MRYRLRLGKASDGAWTHAKPSSNCGDIQRLLGGIVEHRTDGGVDGDFEGHAVIFAVPRTGMWEWVADVTVVSHSTTDRRRGTYAQFSGMFWPVT